MVPFANALDNDLAELHYKQVTNEKCNVNLEK